MTTTDPLYLRTPRVHRHAGGLGELWRLLDAESRIERTTTEDVREDTGWHWRVLPRGALVALRCRGDLWGRRELRLARTQAPADEMGWQAWERDVAVFLKVFGIEPLDGKTPCDIEGRQWLREPFDPRDQGKAAARFIELRRGEVKPGRALCWDCLSEGTLNDVGWWASAGPRGQRCNRHALQARKAKLDAAYAEGTRIVGRILGKAHEPADRGRNGDAADPA